MKTGYTVYRIRAIDFAAKEFSMSPDNDPDAFYAYHAPALEKNEARHNMLLGLMPQRFADASDTVRRWTLGGPGACAILTSPDRPIILGELNERQCHALAEEVYATDFAGVIRAGEAPHWFAARARELGVNFKEPMPQRIHEIVTPPRFPGSAGNARLVTLADIDVYVDWTLAFQAEAVPDDPQPSREHLEKRLMKGTTLFWEVDGKPVSMAASARQTRSSASIAPVYTLPEYRGRGHAGSVTAALVERLFATGRTMVCLCTDLRNISSNRCYANIGFKPVCDAWCYQRREFQRI